MRYVYIILVLVLLPVAQALQITQISPSGLQSGSLTNLAATTDELANCTFSVNNIQGNFPVNKIQHSATISLVDSKYNYVVECSNGFSSTTDQTSFIVDTLAPEISITDWPEEIVTQPYQVEIETNEPASCKYSEQDINYNQMQNSMQKITSKKHFTTVHDQSQGYLKYYLGCKDDAGRISYDEKEFYINLQPTAQISLKEGPLKAGIYDVTLTTSETLAVPPSLSYSFDGTNRGVSLKKEGNQWKGFVMIADGDGESVATFGYKGTDASGTVGREITIGKIFVIDTEKPDTIQSLAANPDDDYIELSWEEVDGVDEYILYRSDEHDVTTTDEFDSSSDNEFLDEDIAAGEKYYYKVAGIDEAGNLGELSEEIEVVALQTKKDQDSLSALLTFKTEQEISNFESELFDFEAMKSDLQNKQDGLVQKIDAEYGVTQQLTTTITSIRSMISEMKNLLDQDLTETELNKRLDKYDERIQTLREETYTGVRVLDEKTISLTASDAAINTAIAEYLEGTEISTDERNNFTLNMKELQSQIRVVGTMVSAELEHSDTPKKVSMMEKTITSDTTLPDASIIEIIPKEYARSASDLVFRPSPIVLEEDPILQWDVSDLNTQKISYALESQKNTNLLSSTSTVVLTRPKIRPKEIPQATGNVVEETTEESNVWQFSLITLMGVAIAGLLLYYFVFMKSDPDSFSLQKYHALALKAHEAVDEVQTEKAKQLYIDLHKRYTKMSDEQKSHAYAVLKNLHVKLRILGNIETAHTALKQNDMVKLQQMVQEISASKTFVSVNTTLQNYLNSNLQYFSDRAS